MVEATNGRKSYNEIKYLFHFSYLHYLIINNNWFGIVEHQESNLNIQN